MSLLSKMCYEQGHGDCQMRREKYGMRNAKHDAIEPNKSINSTLKDRNWNWDWDAARWKKGRKDEIAEGVWSLHEWKHSRADDESRIVG